MLYQDKPLGRASLLARLATTFGRRRYADIDLRNMNAHLRRDLGLGEFLAGDVWRK